VPPTGWAEHCDYAGSTEFSQSKIKNNDPVLKILFARVDAEQRCMLLIAEADKATRLDIWPRIQPVQKQIIASNTEWLKKQSTKQNLLDTSVYGNAASRAAWLIVQHSDHDPAWQKDMLEVVEKLYRAGKFEARQYALLVDRIAVNAGEPQTYGSQGKCAKDGKWHPKPIRNDENISELRKSMGLIPMHENIKRFICK